MGMTSDLEYTYHDLYAISDNLTSASSAPRFCKKIDAQRNNSARGDLGDTRAQFIQKFGNPITIDTAQDLSFWVRKGWIIGAFFDEKGQFA
jgi:hypothetical protein